ncbi:hypothetical protein [Citrobacter koseri]|uniref:hypothetical protein n=1 Tax=Citrobacter koseri TaxID=545 RepID=UPI000D73004F|nr:hypothetical protein [Citrobacter koseri]PWY09696.1 hypothetical protein DL345_08720 [Citrobacter koseri]
MIDYSPARKEIKASQKCLKLMLASQNHDEFEQNWRDFLGHLEKAYNKLLCATKPVKDKFSSHFSKRIMHRKTDQTLVYLYQARNTDQHSTEEIARLSPSHTTFSSIPGAKGHYIEKLHINGNGMITEYKGDPLVVTFHPKTTKAIKIRNYGKDYHPPTIHLGEKLSSNHPSNLAAIGIKFYEDWIEDSSVTFK